MNCCFQAINRILDGENSKVPQGLCCFQAQKRTQKVKAQSMRRTWPTLLVALDTMETSFLVMVTMKHCLIHLASMCEMARLVLVDFV